MTAPPLWPSADRLPALLGECAGLKEDLSILRCWEGLVLMDWGVVELAWWWCDAEAECEASWWCEELVRTGGEPCDNGWWCEELDFSDEGDVCASMWWLELADERGEFKDSELLLLDVAWSEMKGNLCITKDVKYFITVIFIVILCVKYKLSLFLSKQRKDYPGENCNNYFIQSNRKSNCSKSIIIWLGTSKTSKIQNMTYTHAKCK